MSENPDMGHPPGYKLLRDVLNEENEMKRSAINRSIAEAAAFFAENRFMLPPYAEWTPDDWQRRGSEADEIRTRQLGWDVTDFNSGDFDSVGLTLFTLRNGSPAGGEGSKIYAEKIMFVRKDQVTPFHYHASKTEDIINRGGIGTGRLAVQLYNSEPGGGLAQTPVAVSCDGIQRQVDAGGMVYLGSGESITLTPYLYHTFYAVDGDGLIGEVSSVNDDATDNYFLEPLPRYPEIVEDEAPLRVLCNEYGKAGNGN
jgi:D-lyxose ketol-isomerase